MQKNPPLDSMANVRAKASRRDHSVLNPYFYEILELRSGPVGVRKNWREIAAHIKKKHGLEVSHTAVLRFMKARTKPGSGYEHPQLFPSPNIPTPAQSHSRPYPTLTPKPEPDRPPVMSKEAQREKIRQAAEKLTKDPKPAKKAAGFTWKE